jgi:hypothetical protein
MKRDGNQSLKSLNMKWLVLLAVADVLFLLLFIAPEVTNRATMTQLGISRILTTTVMPVVVLLVVNVLPHDLKSMFVYWKPLGVLPGSEVFTKYGPLDPRIDMNELKKNVGVFPTLPTEQNSKWYKLYKMVPNEPEVLEAHKMFLLYRDMAVLSLALIVVAPFWLSFAGSTTSAIVLTFIILATQYLLTAVSARWCGVRFVCNVLAIHSAKKVTIAKTSGAK